ncbi:hypothetical protein D3C76_1202320 [compost metagenome]
MIVGGKDNGRLGAMVFISGRQLVEQNRELRTTPSGQTAEIGHQDPGCTLLAQGRRIGQDHIQDRLVLAPSVEERHRKIGQVVLECECLLLQLDLAAARNVQP